MAQDACTIAYKYVLTVDEGMGMAAASRLKTVKASEARQNWSELLGDVYKNRTRIIVEKSGIPMAAVISVADLERFLRFEARRDEDFKVLEESWRAFEGVPDDEIEEQVAQAVTEARRQLREERKKA